MIYLLDTSALCAHYFRENGHDSVQALLLDSGHEVAISVLTLFEFHCRLAGFHVPKAEREQAAAQYSECFDSIYPVTEAVCTAAIPLRDAATARAATVDILIAATAKVHGAILVHRAPHFTAIPAEHLKQLVLPEK